ncbi:2,3-bisphosphoglycerate-independent phosphoglycerate mutase [Candidatus Uhrbacteria bacterium]|nr:2,3-bisphosphoglycerate-independent phosphoglycerate mutase [Candidatus Uhrbacteria bacterium]
MATRRPKPVVVCVLDGYGVAPESTGNAIAHAERPVFDRLIRAYPAMTLHASGLEVGLARGEMGNSEVGHLNIGAGRVFYQSRPRIDKEIQQGSFHENPVFRNAVAHIQKHGSKLHIMGLLSPGGVHSHQEHCFALLEFAQRAQVAPVYLHLFLDGRDAIYNSGIGFVRELLRVAQERGRGTIATLAGRYYAMDRDNRWDRVEKAYRAMVEGVGMMADDPLHAIAASYEMKMYDEEFLPTVCTASGKPVATIGDGDAVLFFNFRADRARQIAQAFVSPKFAGFDRRKLQNLFFGAMMEYEQGLPMEVAYPSESIPTCLAKVWSEKKLQQLHIAETEKYAHVTFFFNAMREEPYPGEERILIPSPKVATYDLQPEMSARILTDRVIAEIESGKYDGVIMNYANPDMVGHTGKLEATIEAIRVVDACIGKLEAAVTAAGGILAITADHGNAEEVLNLQTGEIDKEHATNPVPFIVCGKSLAGQVNEELRDVDWNLHLLPPVGMLADVAPTVLQLMGIRQPEAMTGRTLL